MSNQTPYDELELADMALARCDDDDGHATFVYQNLKVTVYIKDHTIHHLRIVTSIANPHADALRELAYSLVTMLLSETTNNDACDVTIRERSAHHADPNLRDCVVIDAIIRDELT